MKFPTLLPSLVAAIILTSCGSDGNGARTSFRGASAAASADATPGPVADPWQDPATDDDAVPPNEASPEPSAAAPDGPATEPLAPEDAPASAPMTEADIFNGLPTGAAQLKALCARPGRDKVRQVFCGPTPPTITSLVELQTALGLGFASPALTGRNNNGTGGNPGFAVTGHSTSLVARFTSSINPRVILFTPPDGNPNPEYVALGFVRGEQLAEIVANDPDTNVPAFFLVSFAQDCNAAETCKPGDLLTPAIEKDWRGLTIYEDVDVENTVVDCKQCHQPGGDGTPKMLRMQELRNPWTHFFRDNTPGGQALIADFRAAHGTTEDYGGIPAALIGSSEPANLEDLVRDNGFGAQPNEFPTRTIEAEVRASSPQQPAANALPGVSATWQRLYANAVAGTVIAFPYHDVKVTDPAKLTAMTAAYQGFRAGTVPAAALPDIREVLLDAMLPDMGFRMKAGLDGAGLLVQACTQCHNSKLPQDLTRARFNVDLSGMSVAEKELAIARMQLPASDPRRMPPARFRSLTAAEIALLTTELRK